MGADFYDRAIGFTQLHISLGCRAGQRCVNRHAGSSECLNFTGSVGFHFRRQSGVCRIVVSNGHAARLRARQHFDGKGSTHGLSSGNFCCKTLGHRRNPQRITGFTFQQIHAAIPR